MGRGRDAGWWWEQMGSPYLPHPAQPRHARSGRPGADTHTASLAYALTLPPPGWCFRFSVEPILDLTFFILCLLLLSSSCQPFGQMLYPEGMSFIKQS